MVFSHVLFFPICKQMLIIKQNLNTTEFYINHLYLESLKMSTRPDISWLEILVGAV